MILFILTCYGISLLTLVLMVFTGAQGYVGLHLGGMSHAALGLLTTIIYLATETLVMFFFIASGVAVKEQVLDHGAPVSFRRRSIAIKSRLFGPLMLNILFVMALAITGGPVHTGAISPWIHGVLFWVAFAHFVWVLLIQHKSLMETMDIFEGMYGSPGNQLEQE